MTKYTRLLVVSAVACVAALHLAPATTRADCLPANGYAFTFDTQSLQPYAVATGDFSSDGVLDVAIASYGDTGDQGRVTVLLGKGDNTLVYKSNYPIGLHPTAIAAIDLNHDGKLDLAVTLDGSDSVAVLLGTGDADGSFTVSPTNFAVGNKPGCIAAGLLNADAFPDVVVGNTDDPGNPISVLLGAGTGAFGTASSFGAGLHVVAVVLTDRNGDGRPDVIVATGMPSTPLKQLINDGNGAFGAPTDVGPAGMYTYVAVANIDGDSVADLVATDAGNNTVMVLLGTGSTNLPVGSHPNFVAAGNVNGDGFADLIVANEGTLGNPADAGGVSVWLGHGNGTFDSVVPYSAPAAPFVNPHALALADLGDDDVLDLLVATRASTSISVLRGQGDGQFPIEKSVTAGNGSAGVVVGDYDGDGYLDLAVANATGADISILRGDANGNYTLTQAVPLSAETYGLAIGDLNNDNRPDIVAVLGLTTDPNPDLAVLLNDGFGAFAVHDQVAVPGTVLRAVAIANVTGDNIPDLVVPGNSTNKIYICRGLGGASFEDPTEGNNVGSNPIGVAVADINADGRMDIISLNATGLSCSVLLRKPDGSFDAMKNSLLGDQPYRFIVAKLDGDTFPDLVITTTHVSPALLTLRGKGDGLFNPPAVYNNIDNGVRAIAVADVTGDSIPDIIAFGAYEGFVLPGVGNATFNPPNTIAACAGTCEDFQDVAVADFDKDGRVDLVLARDGTPGAAVVMPNIGGQLSITDQPASTSVGTGQTATFAVGVHGFGARSYRWQKDGVALSDGGHYSGTASATLTISNASATEQGTYAVVVGCNGVLSNPATLTVTAQADPCLNKQPQITQQPAAATVNAGQSVSFTVTANSPLPLRYQWRKGGSALSDGGAISGSRAATLTVNPTVVADSGAYDCQVTNDCGTTGSQTATLVVNNPSNNGNNGGNNGGDNGNNNGNNNGTDNGTDNGTNNGTDNGTGNTDDQSGQTTPDETATASRCGAGLCGAGLVPVLPLLFGLLVVLKLANGRSSGRR